MDIYTNPDKSTYVTGITKFFTMPTDSGGIPAVAVSKRASVYITNAYTILMILIFMIGWNLIIAIVMAFWPTKEDPNRQTALVALWNSGESMNAMTLMISYCGRVILRMRKHNHKEAPSDPEAERVQSHLAPVGPGPKVDSSEIGPTVESVPLAQEKQNGATDGASASSTKCGASDLLWGLLFVFIAFAMTVGNVAAGIFVPVQLSMGNVAPPAKGVIFYPDVARYAIDGDGGAGQAKLDSLKAPSALRALGSIEASEVTVRDRVHVESGIDKGSAHLSYDYNVTGVDLGLQSDPKLKLMVKGSCRTDDTWLLNSTDEGDTYGLFGGNETFLVKYQPKVDIPPMVNFFTVRANTGGLSNVSYAMLINTGGLYSFTAGQDPWYVTDKTEDGGSVAYQVRRKRPALSCWEAKTWHLNGKEVDGLMLDKLPGLKLDKFWVDKVFPFEFGVPRVVSVGRAAGSSALKSASYAAAPFYVLDAGASAILTDLERLVLASWVSSRNVLRDTTTYKYGDMINLLKGQGGSVGDGSAKFVLQSGDVVTLSVRILIAVPAILLFLFIVQKALGCVLRYSEFGQKCILPGEEKNGVALVAAQLYRGLDERINSRDWQYKEELIPFFCPYEAYRPVAGTDPNPKLGGTVTQKQVGAEK